MTSKRRIWKLKHLLAWPSGALMSILDRYPAEESFYVALGTLVWVIAFLGGCGMTLNLRTMGWSVPGALFGGLVWSQIILNLDRFLLLVRTDTNGWGNKVKVGIRIAMGLCIAMIVGESIIQYIFHNEIRIELQAEGLATRKANRSAALDSFPELAMLQKEREEKLTDSRSKAKEVSALRDLYVKEGTGEGGSRVPGLGARYELDKTNHEAAVAEKEKLDKELAAIDARIEELKKSLTLVLDPINAAVSNDGGFLSNHRALFAVMKREPTAWILYGAISLVMLLLEITPLLAKLGRKRSIYETLLDQQDETILKLAETQGDIQRHVLYRVNSEIRAGQASSLAGQEAQVAESILNHARYFIDFELGRQGVADQPAGPSANLTAVTILHPATEAFDVLFTAAEVTACQLAEALKALEPSLSSAGHPVSFDGHRPYNDDGVELQPGLKLLPQLGASRRIHFKPVAFTVAA